MFIDALPVSLRSSMHVKILQTNEFVENVLPANSALFFLRFDHVRRNI